MCVSVECVQVLFQSWNLAAMFVHMAKCFHQVTPLMYPTQAIELHDQQRFAYYLFNVRVLI